MVSTKYQWQIITVVCTFLLVAFILSLDTAPDVLQTINDQHSTLKFSTQIRTTSDSQYGIENISIQTVDSALNAVHSERYEQEDIKPSVKSLSQTEYIHSLITQIGQSNPDQKASLIQLLWIRAADMDDFSEAIMFLENLVRYDYDEQVVELAVHALEDLNRLQKKSAQSMLESSLPVIQSKISINKPVTSVISEHDIAITEAQGIYQQEIQGDEDRLQINILSEQALTAINETERRQAILALSQFRDNAAVDALLQTSDDLDARNRYLSVEALWYSAADGLDKDQQINLKLQLLINDADEKIAQLAKAALTDLNNLERKNQNEISIQPVYSYADDNSYSSNPVDQAQR